MDVTLFSAEVHDCYIEKLVGETFNAALLDSGCTRTVCGESWFQCFKDTLTDADASQLCVRKLQMQIFGLVMAKQ